MQLDNWILKQIFLNNNEIVSIMFLFGLKFFIKSKIVQVSKK